MIYWVILIVTISATSWENQQSAFAKTKMQISFAVTEAAHFSLFQDSGELEYIAEEEFEESDLEDLEVVVFSFLFLVVFAGFLNKKRPPLPSTRTHTHTQKLYK